MLFPPPEPAVPASANHADLFRKATRMIGRKFLAGEDARSSWDQDKNLRDYIW